MTPAVSVFFTKPGIQKPIAIKAIIPRLMTIRDEKIEPFISILNTNTPIAMMRSVCRSTIIYLLTI